MKGKDAEKMKNQQQAFTISDKQYERILRSAINEYMNELIPEEKVERIMTPIHERIERGEFTKSNRKKPLPSPILCVIAAGLILTLIPIALYQNIEGTQGIVGETHIEVQDPSIPLAGLTLNESFIHIVLTLIDKSASEIIEVLEDVEGTVPDGTWRVIVTLDGQQLELGKLIVKDGTAKLIR